MAAAETPPSSPSSSDGVFSLEDLDKIIESEDPNFKNQMADIKAIGADISADIETLNIDGEVGADNDSNEADETLSRKDKIIAFVFRPWRRFKEIFKLKKLAFKNKMLMLYEQMKTFVRHELPERSKYYYSRTISAIKHIVTTASNLIAKFKALTKIQKITLFATTILSVAAISIFSRTFLGGWLPRFSDPLVNSLEEKARFVRAYTGKEDLQNLFEAFPEVEFHVLMTKVIVNLRPDEKSGPNPMGVYEVYLGLDSQDTAIEVKDREKELLDIIQRVIERFSYSEVSTQVGKIRMKSMIRDRVNEVLNQGRVFHVYFNTFISNP